MNKNKNDDTSTHLSNYTDHTQFLPVSLSDYSKQKADLNEDYERYLKRNTGSYVKTNKNTYIKYKKKKTRLHRTDLEAKVKETTTKTQLV